MKHPSLLPTIVGALALLSIFSQKSRADIAIVAQEGANGVVFSYTGSLRESELGNSFPSTLIGEVRPQSPEVQFAPNGGGSNNGVDVYYNAMSSRPADFGSGFSSYPTTFTGDYFGVDYSNVMLPDVYNDNAPISGTMTFTGATFSSMGMTPSNGIPYVWRLTNGETVSLLIENTSLNIQEKAALEKKIKKLKAQLKNAKRRKKKGKAKKLKKKLKALKAQLNAL